MSEIERLSIGGNIFSPYVKEISQGIDPLEPALRLARVAQTVFDKWFNGNIQGKHFYDPKDAVEVTCYKSIHTTWHATEIGHELTTHKALLINISPIKQETCIELLRAISDNWDSGKPFEESLATRANAALKREEEK